MGVAQALEPQPPADPRKGEPHRSHTQPCCRTADRMLDGAVPASPARPASRSGPLQTQENHVPDSISYGAWLAGTPALMRMRRTYARTSWWPAKI